jgi:hypothetical protein
MFIYWNGQGRNSTDLCEKEYSQAAMNDEKALAQRRRLSRVVGRPGCNIVNNVNCCVIIDLAHDSAQKMTIL